MAGRGTLYLFTEHGLYISVQLACMCLKLYSKWHSGPITVECLSKKQHNISKERNSVYEFWYLVIDKSQLPSAINWRRGCNGHIELKFTTWTICGMVCNNNDRQETEFMLEKERSGHRMKLCLCSNIET